MLFTKFESLLPKVIDLPLPGIVAQKKNGTIVQTSRNNGQAFE